MVKKLRIILRTCARVKNVGSSGRPFEMDKFTILFKCLRSLLESCNQVKERISIEIVDDASDKEITEKIKAMLGQYEIPWKFHEMNFKNNGKSLEYAYQLCDNSTEELLYVGSDDFFYLKQAIPAILEAYDSKLLFTSEFCIYPCDYPRNYVNIHPSLIFAGRRNHWRSVNISDGALVMTRGIFNKFKDIFFKFARFNIKGHGGEDQTINKITGTGFPCIAPIETLAAHLHSTCMPLYVDWKKEIDSIQI
jgi:hypothetical protein